MQTFKDKDGQEWTIEIDVNAIKRARDLAGFDLLSVLNDNGAPLGRMCDDVVLLIDVIYAVVKPQADDLGMTDEDFGRGLFGDPIREAMEALLSALPDFFPDPIQRETTRIVIEKIQSTVGEVLKTIETAAEKWDKADPKVLAKIALKQSGNSLESSASTPDPSVSAS